VDESLSVRKHWHAHTSVSGAVMFAATSAGFSGIVFVKFL
jgi:hypothetical protein